MLANNINWVVSKGLCTSCGTCAAICPHDCIDIVKDNKRGLYVPILDNNKCNQCGLCFKVCPGHAVDFKQLNEDIFGNWPGNILIGNYLSCYMSHATDYNIRYNSASGGLVTALLIFALEEGIIDGALVTRMRKDKPLEPEPFIARTREEIISSAKSKYCPVPATLALKEILKNEGRYAIVGLPCHLHGIRKAESLIKRLRERIVLHFGLFCAHADTFHATEFLLQKHKIRKDQVTHIDYRGLGWPGSMTICLKDGSKLSLPVREYFIIHTFHFFTPERCSLCCDRISRLADITFMDAWLPEITANDKIGTSLVIVRSDAGASLYNKAEKKGIVKSQAITQDKIIESQGRSSLSNRDLPVFFWWRKLVRRAIPNYSLNLPSPKFTNYLRTGLISINRLISTRMYVYKLISALAYLEESILSRWHQRT